MKLFVASKAEVVRQSLFILLGMIGTIGITIEVMSSKGYHPAFSLVLIVIALVSALIWGKTIGDLIIRAKTKLEVRYNTVYIKQPWKAGREYRLCDMMVANVHIARTWFRYVPSWLVFTQKETFQAHWCDLPILGSGQASQLMDALVERVLASQTHTYVDLTRD